MTNEQIKVSLSALLARAHRRKKRADGWFAFGIAVVGLLALGVGFEFGSETLGMGDFLSTVLAIVTACFALAGLGHLAVKVDVMRGKRLAKIFLDTYPEETGDYARALAILRASKTESKVEKNLQEALDKDVTFDPAAMPKAGSFSGGGLLGGLGGGAATTTPAETQGAESPAAAKKEARPQPRPDYVPLDPYQADD